MKAILAIVCFALIACASAYPGYNYQQPQQVPGSNVNSIQPQLQSIQPNYVASIQALASQFGSQPSQVAGPQSQYAPASVAGNNPANQYVASVQQQANSNQQYEEPQKQVIISKDIYIHSAPEETEEIGNDQSPEANAPIRKNYRIVFVKAPVHNIRLNLQSIKSAQAANEERTIIYVLSKKPDIANIQSQLLNVQSEQKAQKPEVFFIKYKTQEEASRAQKEIQAQYEALGGATRISDEGISSVTSVVGGASLGSEDSASNSSPSVASNSNFVQAPSSNNQQFVQPSFLGKQEAGSSSASFGNGAPGLSYLPVQKY